MPAPQVQPLNVPIASELTRTKYHLGCDNGTRSRNQTSNRRLLAATIPSAQIACRTQENQCLQLGPFRAGASVSPNPKCDQFPTHRPRGLAKKSRRGSRPCQLNCQYRGQAFSCGNSRHLRSVGVFPRRSKVRRAPPLTLLSRHATVPACPGIRACGRSFPLERYGHRRCSRSCSPPSQAYFSP